MATRDASRAWRPATELRRKQCPGLSEDSCGMTGEEAVVVTAVVAPEAGREEEQPPPPAGLGCEAPEEPGRGRVEHGQQLALEGIWSIKRNLPVEGLKPGLPSRNSLLPQAKYYSRHGGLRR
ncbi:uncharacterized protein C11orf97 homolog isoform X2 [Macaca fascicularis]|uniref:uncharacterized protein C11orf97 homolog isoform X2 n=1 Tax=Macaca fascicularis TaxID=9541 RepID=UPI003D155F67